MWGKVQHNTIICNNWPPGKTDYRNSLIHLDQATPGRIIGQIERKTDRQERGDILTREDYIQRIIKYTAKFKRHIRNLPY